MMNRNNWCLVGFWCSMLTWNASILFADIVDIGPFVGTHTETYDDIVGVSFQELELMDGLATITNLTDGGAIKIEMSSSFNGDLVVPKSAPQMMGQLGILRWDFAQPIIRFGSYFENNSGTDDAIAEFFDLNGDSLGTQIVEVGANTQDWTWNGWESDTPFSAIVVTGNATQFLNGFIWYEDTQATISSVPEPSAATMLAAFTLLMIRRNRKTNQNQ